MSEGHTPATATRAESTHTRPAGSPASGRSASSALLSMQRLAGNRSVTAAVQRRPSSPNMVVQRRYAPGEREAAASNPGQVQEAPDGVLLSHFTIGSEQLKPNHTAFLRAAAASRGLRGSSPTLRVELVEGHTDQAGDIDQGPELRRMRAESVAQGLLGNGVQAMSIGTVSGAGRDRYLRANDTPEHRSTNRSVLMRFVENSRPNPTPAPTPTPARARACGSGSPEQTEARSIGAADLAQAMDLARRHRGTAIGYFFAIYSRLIRGVEQGVANCEFENPLWMARLNHDTFQHLVQGLQGGDGYGSVLTECRNADSCRTNPLLPNAQCFVMLQTCVVHMGYRHLMHDLQGELRNHGCGTDSQRRDYARVVPMFHRANIEGLTEAHGAAGEYMALLGSIPVITAERDAAWHGAGCSGSTTTTRAASSAMGVVLGDSRRRGVVPWIGQQLEGASRLINGVVGR